jgi:uncharacterized membrane protein YeaQ/YmgE (transglycosylase-associated protein family)
VDIPLRDARYGREHRRGRAPFSQVSRDRLGNAGRPSPALLARASMTSSIARAAAGTSGQRQGGVMTLMNFVWMVILGLVIGALARFFYPGAVAMGWIATTVLGIVGSLVGGLIGSLFSRGKAGFQPAGLVMSIIGAVIVLWAWLNFMQ